MHARVRRRTIAITAGLMMAATQVLAATPASADAGSTVAARQVQGPCAAPGDPVPMTSVQQVSELAVGTWIRCEGPPQFGQVGGGEVGVQVDADGRFYRLFEAGDGTLVRADGPDQEGAWTVIDTTSMNGPGSYQLDWSVLGGGTVITLPEFFEAPLSVRLVDIVQTARYEPWTGAAPVPGLPPGVGTGSCGRPTGPITPASVVEVQDLLVGAWTLCGDQSVLGDATGEFGIEFSADGHFHRIVLDSAGSRIRATGNGQEGTWTLLDSTSVNGPGSFQLDLQIIGRGTVPTFPLFLESPPFVRFVGDGLVGAEYLKADPLPQPPPEPPQAGPPPVEPSADAARELPATGNGTGATLLVLAALLMLLGMALRAGSRVARRRPNGA